jgi:membrane-associated protein
MLLGYFLGDTFPHLGESIDQLIIVILAFSVLPIAYEWWRHRRTNAPEAADLDHDGVPDRDIAGMDTTHDPRHRSVPD